jgi:hypothetical protein
MAENVGSAVFGIRNFAVEANAFGSTTVYYKPRHAAPGILNTAGLQHTFSEPLFGSSPFAAPNSRSPPKFDHSLSFTLLLKYTRATLHHGCTCPGPNHDAASSSACRSAPPPTTHYPPNHYPLSLILCFHALTNPFSRNSFLFTSMQNPRGCGGQLLSCGAYAKTCSSKSFPCHSYTLSVL